MFNDQLRSYNCGCTESVVSPPWAFLGVDFDGRDVAESKTTSLLLPSLRKVEVKWHCRVSLCTVLSPAVCTGVQNARCPQSLRTPVVRFRGLLVGWRERTALLL